MIFTVIRCCIDILYDKELTNKHYKYALASICEFCIEFIVLGGILDLLQKF